MECQKYFKFREDVAQSPLRILHQQTKQSIASKLDSRKLLLTSTRLHRDWRGLAENVNLDSSVIKSGKISYTEHCFHLWIQQTPGTVIRELWHALECIDRFDVIEDTIQLIYNDYDYAMSKDILGLKPIPSWEDNAVSISEFDSNVLTTDDQKNLVDGGPLQYYDALVLFADEDLDFVDEMVQNLEGKYNLKLCLKDRDLVGGLAFELSAVLRLIEERCSRVVVVLSPDFLESKANKFFTVFAHALSIDQQRRIVIPCMFKPCKKPSEISYCHSLDYFRTNGYWDYWKKLHDSIIYKSPHRSGVVLREITSSNPSSNATSSLPANMILPSPPCSSPSAVSSSGILSRIRRRTGDQADKKKSKMQEVPAGEKANEKISDGPTSLNAGLYFQLPDVPLDTEDSDSRSTYSCESRSPTSTTFSTSPLLPARSSREGTIRNMLKKVIKFKKKKELAL